MITMYIGLGLIVTKCQRMVLLLIFQKKKDIIKLTIKLS